MDVKISGGQLVVSYADETSQAYDLPDGMGGGSGVDAKPRALRPVLHRPDADLANECAGVNIERPYAGLTPITTRT